MNSLKKPMSEGTGMKKRKRSKSSFCAPSSKRRKYLAEKILADVSFGPDQCCFCCKGYDSKLGIFYQGETIAVHQFCLLFSINVPQRGADSEGFDGFILSDIYKEARRAQLRKCYVCRHPGASCYCAVQSCRYVSHFSCGKIVGNQFKFSGAFEVYCKTHRSYQDLKIARRVKQHFNCPVCLEEIIVEDRLSILRAPCCKNVFIHRACVEKQADVSGYFFRCPTCNDSKQFPKEMADHGVYIPKRDAAWEEGEAFSDLLQQYGKCDMNKCKSNNGRSYNTCGRFQILLCYVCGQSGAHLTCLGKYYIPGVGFVCNDCNPVLMLSHQELKLKQIDASKRHKIHQERLRQLTARDDPVLLASPVFAEKIWKNKYKIKECRVVIKPLVFPVFVGESRIDAPRIPTKFTEFSVALKSTPKDIHRYVPRRKFKKYKHANKHQRGGRGRKPGVVLQDISNTSGNFSLSENENLLLSSHTIISP